MLDWLLTFPLPLIWFAFFWTMPCGCLCTTCLICQDSFDRADNDNIATGSSCSWTEDAGAAEIAGDQLRFTAASSRVLSGVTNPGNQNIDLGGLVTFADVDDEFRVYFDYSTSTDNHFVLFTQTSDTNVEVKLFRAGVQQGDTFNFESPIDSAVPWHVCVFEGTLRVTAAIGFTTTTGAFFDTSSFFAASGWGLGTGALTSELFVDALIANRSALDGCRCHHPCSPDCPAEQRIDVISGAVPSGCGGNCQTNAGMVNGASFYLSVGGACRIGDVDSCDVTFASVNACCWSFSVSNWCPALSALTEVTWSLITEKGDPLFAIPDRIRITYLERWFVDPNFTERWIIFEDAVTFDHASECSGMVNRSISQLCVDNDDDALQCADDTLAIDVTSII